MSGGQFRPRNAYASVGTELLLTDWVRWMLAAGFVERTTRERVIFVRWLEREIGQDVLTASWQTLADFFVRIAPARKPSTVHSYFKLLRAWYEWLYVMDHRGDDPTRRMRAPKVPRRGPRPVTVEQVATLLDSGIYGRTRTMVLLGAYQGLRCFEIAKIRGEDLVGGELHVLGKGGAEDWLPLHPLVETEAAQYPRQGWWFPSYARPDQHVHGNSVSGTVGQAMRRCGIDATAHQLRHFFGTEAHRAARGNLRVAQELLRHASPATTALYTKVDDSERRAAVMGLPQPSGRH